MAERVGRAIDVAQTVYRWTLCLYPEAFHHRYASELESDFHDASHDGYAHHGTRGLLTAWLRAFLDLPPSLLREWSRTPWPLAAAAAFLVATFVLFASVFRAYGPLRAYHRRVAAGAQAPPDSPELLLLLFLLVLVPVGATVIVAGVSALTIRRRPARRRIGGRHV